MSNNLFHLKSHKRSEENSGAFISLADDSENVVIKPANDAGKKGFLTAELDVNDKNRSVSNVIKKSASQLPFIARIKNELMANSHEDNQSISEMDEEGGDNPYDYFYKERSQSVAMPSGMNLDMLTFNTKGPSKNEERLKKLRDVKKNELMAYQNDSVETGVVGQEGEKVFAETSKEQEQRIKKNSPYGGLVTWKLLRIIIKANDDVRQE
jgi:hypothetical protein